MLKFSKYFKLKQSVSVNKKYRKASLQLKNSKETYE